MPPRGRWLQRTAPAKMVAKSNAHGSIPTDGTGDDFRHPFPKANEWIQKLNNHDGGLKEFSKGYEMFGINFARKRTTTNVEWAPNAVNAGFIGDLNCWYRQSHPMKNNAFGVWEITLPPVNGKPAIPHNTKVKIDFEPPSGGGVDSLPAWIKRVTQDLSLSPVYDAVFWNPEKEYILKSPRPGEPKSARVHEAHVAISTTEYRVGTHTEFTANVIPRINKLGYIVIQLVTVLLDIVHPHACKNVLDGINKYDRGVHLYFHEGGRGRHELWNSGLFNYVLHELLRFPISNLRLYMGEYHFDGFRFNGVTGILYTHRRIGTGSSGGIVDQEGVVYLSLANEMSHVGFHEAIAIEEDVSGMPGLCVPFALGGVAKDDEWDMSNIWWILTNRRHGEKTIAYAENKSILTWLCDKVHYTDMSTLTGFTSIFERGLGLHKMTRLLTHGLGGEGYLNFEGNKFSNPESLVFPRAGNNNSFHYARHGLLHAPQVYISLKHDGDTIIVFERSGFVFVFNFHPTESFADFRIGIERAGTYLIVLNIDRKEFRWLGGIDESVRFFTTDFYYNGRRNFTQVDIHTGTAIVLALEDV
ncbi:glycoside hydrolase superfamily [Tuber indicum]|nr:glycoside hydrolase superfamily [Tuber indicum]